jgi:hypothetical protein
MRFAGFFHRQQFIEKEQVRYETVFNSYGPKKSASVSARLDLPGKYRGRGRHPGRSDHVAAVRDPAYFDAQIGKSPENRARQDRQLMPSFSGSMLTLPL